MPVGVHPAPFQIDHVVARQHGGSSDADNLAFCCMHCNRYKGPNIAGIDPQTGGVVRLFHPRRDHWAEHFAWEGNKIVGVSRVGAVTLGLLQMNAPEVVALRVELEVESEGEDSGLVN
jgi:hypothetical protein